MRHGFLLIDKPLGVTSHDVVAQVRRILGEPHIGHLGTLDPWLARSFEARVLVSARRLRELEVTTSAELPAAEPIDTVPRVLKQVGLMGLPEGATVDETDAT